MNLKSSSKTSLISLILFSAILISFHLPVTSAGYWGTGTPTDHVVIQGDKISGTNYSFKYADNNCFKLDGDEDYPHFIDIKVWSNVYKSTYNNYRVKITIDRNDWTIYGIARLHIWIHHDSLDWELLASIHTSTHSANYYIDSDNYWNVGNYRHTCIRFTTDPGYDMWNVHIDAAVIQAEYNISP